MKKIFSFLLIAAGLLVGTQSKADNTVSLTIGNQVTEYATLEDAVAAAVIAGEGVIKLLPAYNRYPQAWLGDCTIEGPSSYDLNDKGLFTFHAFNPDNGDESAYQKKIDETPLSSIEENRIKAIYGEINPNLTPAGIETAMGDVKLLGGYASWASDFEVYFDADIDAADYVIAGNYGDWGWLSSYNQQDFAIDATAFQRFCLLGSTMPDNTLRYWELMTSVFNFHCGIISRNAEKNAGKTFWCELYLYYPDNKNIKLLMDRTPYTFPIRPVVVHSQAVETPKTAGEIAELKAENAGVKAMTDDMTNLYPATKEFEPLAEKCIVVVLTDVQITTVGEVYEQNSKEITYEVTPKYVSEDGTLTVIPNSEIIAPITFRLPVLAEYAGKKVAIYHKANNATEEDYVGMFDVQQEGTSYYVELSASNFSKYIIKSVNNFYERATSVNMIGTLCVPYDIVADSLAVSGADFFEIDYRNNAVTTSVSEVEGTEVNALVGGKAYVFYASGDLLHVGWAEGATAKPVDAGTMVGNLDAKSILPASLYAAGTIEPYIITGDGMFHPCGPQAFVPTNRAYLNMAVVPTTKTSAPGRRIRLTSNGANVVTEIVNVNANANANRKMMVNGQLVIMKNGKMFNAQGQEL